MDGYTQYPAGGLGDLVGQALGAYRDVAVAKYNSRLAESANQPEQFDNAPRPSDAQARSQSILSTPGVGGVTLGQVLLIVGVIGAGLIAYRLFRG